MKVALEEVQCWDLAPETTAGAPAPPPAGGVLESQSPAPAEGPLEAELAERRQQNARSNLHAVNLWWPCAANGRQYPAWHPPTGCTVAIRVPEIMEQYRWDHLSPGVPADLSPSSFFVGQDCCVSPVK